MQIQPKHFSLDTGLTPRAPALVFVLLLWTAGIISCQYSLVKDKSVALPSNLQSISIPLAKNLTIEAGLEDTFTQELIKRLTADGRIKILEAGRAEAELRCTIQDISTQAVSYSREGRVAAENIGIEAECMIVVPESESVVWRTGLLAAAEEYPVGDNYLLNEDLKARAIIEVCKDLSESIRSLLIDSF